MSQIRKGNLDSTSRGDKPTTRSSDLREENMGQLNDQGKIQNCAVVDLSALGRVSVRGKDASTHLESAGFELPGSVNTLSVGTTGESVLRLGPNEYWLLASLVDLGDSVAQFTANPLPAEHCYSLYCQDSHVWFAMTGTHVPEVMAKLCGVDLSPTAFPSGSIAQTSVARVNAIVANHLIEDVPVFSLLCDSASGLYLWDCLLDAIAEFDGSSVELEAFRTSVTE